MIVRRKRTRSQRGEPRRGPGRGRGWAAPLLGWLEEHPRAALASLGRLWRNPGSTLMTALVIAIALALPGALWILLTNTQAASEGWDSGAAISVYLEADLNEQAVAEVEQALAGIDGATLVRTISDDEALAEFREMAGFDAALAELTDNPLPYVVVVEPTATGAGATELGDLADRLAGVTGVDRAQVDLEWVQRLHALLALIERGILLLAALLGAGVLLIVGNTIRLDVLNRRSEIEVIKLIGGTDAFIQRPFLYGGFWYGLAGGIGACGLLILLTALLATPTAELAEAYGSGFRLQGLGAREAAFLLLGGGLLGLIGARLAVGRHLRAIEPA